MSALNEILGYLAQTLLNIALIVVLLRFLLQAARADFYNPITQLLAILVVLLLNGVSPPNPGLLLAWSALGVVGLVVNLYFFAILAMIIVSWVAAGSRHPAVTLLFQLTEPVMARFRRLLPDMGGLDFSPILVFILINVIQIALRHLAVAIGLPPALVIGL